MVQVGFSNEDNRYQSQYIYKIIHIHISRESASRFSRGTVLNTLKQSGINILRGNKDTTTFSRQACLVYRFTLYRNHLTSFRHPCKKKRAIEIHLGPQRPKKVVSHQVRILRSCQPYSNESKKCNLCFQEKYFIIFRKDLSSLKKSNELARSCRHKNRLTLKFF